VRAFLRHLGLPIPAWSCGELQSPFKSRWPEASPPRTQSRIASFREILVFEPLPLTLRRRRRRGELCFSLLPRPFHCIERDLYEPPPCIGPKTPEKCLPCPSCASGVRPRLYPSRSAAEGAPRTRNRPLHDGFSSQSGGRHPELRNPQAPPKGSSRANLA